MQQYPLETPSVTLVLLNSLLYPIDIGVFNIAVISAF